MTTDREFRLALEIKDDPEVPGAHAALVVTHEENKATPLLVIEAGGFPADKVGAAMLADMLSDAAEAIREHLSAAEMEAARQSTDTANLPAMDIPPVTRPRFNPRPPGGK